MNFNSINPNNYQPSGSRGNWSRIDNIRVNTYFDELLVIIPEKENELTKIFKKDIAHIIAEYLRKVDRILLQVRCQQL